MNTVEDNLIERRLTEIVKDAVYAEVTRWIELPNDRIQRADYDERFFIVSWERDGHMHNYGTHRATINSLGGGMLVSGSYLSTDEEAHKDFLSRHPVLDGMMNDTELHTSEKTMAMSTMIHRVR